MPDWVVQRDNDMGVAEVLPHTNVIDFRKPFSKIPNLLECSDGDNNSDCSDKSDEYSVGSASPADPSDQRSDVSPPTTSINSETSMSNGSSNSNIGSIS